MPSPISLLLRKNKGYWTAGKFLEVLVSEIRGSQEEKPSRSGHMTEGFPKLTRQVPGALSRCGGGLQIGAGGENAPGSVTSPTKEAVGVLPAHSCSHPASLPGLAPVWQLKQLPQLGKNPVYNAIISLPLPIPL